MMRQTITREQGLVVLAVCVLSIAQTRSDAQDAKQKERKMEPRISVVTLGVSDLARSYRFYKDGLGLPTKMKPDGGIVIFATAGTRLSLYSYQKLAEDVGIELPEQADRTTVFHGITLAHAVRNKTDVEKLLRSAEQAGGNIVNKAQDVFWGGYSGYFSDPDGYLWEINSSDAFKFGSDGSLAIE